MRVFRLLTVPSTFTLLFGLAASAAPVEPVHFLWHAVDLPTWQEGFEDLVLLRGSCLRKSWSMPECAFICGSRWSGALVRSLAMMLKSEM